MDRSPFMITVLSLSFLVTPRTNAQPETDSILKKNAGDPTITITKLDVTDTTLELSWEIRNDSGQDAWILAGWTRSEASISAFRDEDDQTLLMRRRLDLAWPGRTPFPTQCGKYVRLRKGQILTESVSLAIPVHPVSDLVGGGKARGLGYATRLAIEIGYYTGDFPGMVRCMLEDDEKNPRIIPSVDPYYPDTLSGWFRGLVGFNKLNELVRSRDNEVLIPYTNQVFTDERVLRVTADELHIPYEEKEDRSEHHPPDLTPFTRVEIRYHPSTLEYFFPYAEEQSLLSPAEKELLQSMKTVVVKNPDNLKALASDVNKAKRSAGITCQKTVAYATCYRDDDCLMSFPIYNNNDDFIVSEGKYRFRYVNGLRSLRLLTPRVQQIELRVRCAANLKHLWNRFRLYEKVAESGFFRGRKKPYPPPNTWCDSMLRTYRVTERSDEYLMRPHKCPSAGQGKCHYAMNPNCKRNSPADMVLLFERKGSWNQHGGPELFTFDNHDPRGGCVLLNDGTVKFIRTTEEFQQLRWK